MDISERQQELLDKYLKEEISEIDLNKFEQAMDENDVLKKEFYFQKALKDAVELDAVRDAMKQAKIHNTLQNKNTDPQFKTIQQSINQARSINLKSERKQTILHLIKRGAIAASIILIGFIGFNNLNKNSGSDLEGDFTAIVSDYEYLKFDHKEVQEVSGKTEVIAYKLEKLEAAHKQEQFNEALKIIQDLKGPQYAYSPVELKYLEAIIYVQKDDYENSVNILNQIINNKSKFEIESRWLRSLIFLKTDEKTKAKEDLEILSLVANKFKKRAQQKLAKHF